MDKRQTKKTHPGPDVQTVSIFQTVYRKNKHIFLNGHNVQIRFWVFRLFLLGFFKTRIRTDQSIQYLGTYQIRASRKNGNPYFFLQIIVIDIDPFLGVHTVSAVFITAPGTDLQCIINDQQNRMYICTAVSWRR